MNIETQQVSSLRTQPVPHCPVCGGSGYILEPLVQDHYFGVPGSWQFRKCQTASCGIAWLDPRPIHADIGLAYANYYTHGTGSESPTENIRSRMKRLIQKVKIKALWLSRTRRPRQHMFLDKHPPGRLLDVGCGGGVTLRLLKKAGWEAIGQELDEKAVLEARRYSGCKVLVGPLENLDLEGESFDAITLSHVIEHLEDPVDTLRTCKKLLKKKRSIGDHHTEYP